MATHQHHVLAYYIKWQHKISETGGIFNLRWFNNSFWFISTLFLIKFNSNYSNVTFFKLYLFCFNNLHLKSKSSKTVALIYDVYFQWKNSWTSTKWHIPVSAAYQIYLACSQMFSLFPTQNECYQRPIKLIWRLKCLLILPLE